MIVVSDETLMAYADGELDAAACTEVEAFLAASPEGRMRLEVFQATGRGLSDLFEQPMREPVPQRLLDAIAAPGKLISFSSVRRSTGLRSDRHVPAALAACLTFLAVGGSAYWFGNRTVNDVDRAFGVEISADGRRVASLEVAAVLDGTAAGKSVSGVIHARQATIKPIFTFATSGKSYCRQYIIATEQDIAFGGVACKAADGRWQVEAHDAFDPAPQNTGQIKPAAGNAGPANVEAAVDRLIAGDVLNPDAEAAVMSSGWRKSP